jgi:hypothetical protein
VAFGTPERSALPAGRSGPSLIPSRTAFGAIAPLVRRQRHHRLMDLGINRQWAIERLFGPFPPQIKGVFVFHPHYQ